MTTFNQMFLGTGLLGFCAIIHVAGISACVPLLVRVAQKIPPNETRIGVAVVVGSAFAAIVLIHTLQIWVWAVTLQMIGAIPQLGEALYFSTVTYTTLGYGDIVLPDTSRMFGTFAAITGLLTFGLSTAFLVGLMARVLPAMMD